MQDFAYIHCTASERLANAEEDRVCRVLYTSLRLPISFFTLREYFCRYDITYIDLPNVLLS